MSKLSTRSERGASELIGVVLLFAFVFAAATVTFYFGMQASSSIQQQNELETAQTTMQAVESELSSLASNNGDAVTKFELSNGASDDVTVRPDGAIYFQVNDRTDCTTRMEMGSIVYENRQGTVAYQAGGVWKTTENGSTLVSEPGLAYTEETVNGKRIRTISFPAVNVNGDIEGGAKTIEARRNATKSRQAQRQMERELCLRGANTSKLTQGGTLQVNNVTVVVENSTYYEAWGQFLSDEFGDAATVKVFDGNNSVVVNDVPLGVVGEESEEAGDAANDRSYQNALYSIGNSKTQIQNDVVVDSYDSDEGPYTSSSGENGRYVTDGDLDITQGRPKIYGDVVVGGDVDISAGNALITGDVYHGGSADVSGSAEIRGEFINEADIEQPDEITPWVESNVSHIRAENTNFRTEVIQDNETVDGDGEIPTGQYYVKDFQVDNDDKIVLNTTGGDILIAVDNKIQLQNNATVEIVGDGQVVWFVEDKIEIKGTATISVADDASWRNWIYCRASCQMEFSSQNRNRQSKFTGVAYAPVSDDNDDAGSIELDNSADVYGALVGGPAQFNGKAELHFDEALLDRRPPSVDPIDDVNRPTGDVDPINDSGGSPDGTVDTNETVSVGDRVYDLESFDVNATLLGTELSGIFPVAPYNADYQQVTSPPTTVGDVGYWERDTSNLDDFRDTSYGGYTGETFTITGSADSPKTQVSTSWADSDVSGYMRIVVTDEDGNVVSDTGNQYLYRDDSRYPNYVTATFDANAGEDYTVYVLKEDGYYTPRSADYEVAVSKGPTIANTPIQIELNTKAPDGDTSSVQPWPASDLPGEAAVDGDTNWPTTSETQSHTLTDLEGGTSFSVTSISYYTDQLNYSGNTETVNGKTMYDLAATTHDGKWVNISATANSNVGNVKILRDGDKVPNVDAAGDEQRSFEQMLGPYVNDSGYLNLNDRQVVFLFELSQEDAEFENAFGSGDPDYNDAVVLYEFQNFQYTCVENCTTDVDDGGDGGDGGDTTDANTPSADSDVEELDGAEISNEYVIQITNSQVVVQAESDDDDS